MTRINTPGFLIDPFFRAAELGPLWRMEEVHVASLELLKLVPGFLANERERFRYL